MEKTGEEYINSLFDEAEIVTEQKGFGSEPQERFNTLIAVLVTEVAKLKDRIIKLENK